MSPWGKYMLERVQFNEFGEWLWYPHPYLLHQYQWFDRIWYMSALSRT